MSAVRPTRSPPALRVIEGGAAPDRTPDLLLARDAATGDRKAAERLYEMNRDRVAATLYRVLGHFGADHEDLIQASFVQLVVSLPSYRGECSLGTWASRIAAHVAFNALRSRKRSGAVFSPEEVGEAESPRHVDPMLAMRLRAALAELSEDKAETVILFDMLGHDLSEVAALMGVTVAAAQSRLVRGREDLRQRLADLAPNRSGKGARG